MARPPRGPEATSTEASGSDTSIAPTCSQEPADGLDIQLGNPAYFGNSCPAGFAFTTQVVSVNGAEVRLAYSCDEGCTKCIVGDGHPLSMLPLSAADHVPMGTCLRVETQAMLLHGEERCHYGSLMIHDPGLGAPYVIATTRTTPPTPLAAKLLAGAIPLPTVALDCECSSVAPGDVCCPEGGPATFWTFTIEGQVVSPGETVPFGHFNEFGVEHTFELFQAQQLHTCEAPELETSWAVVVPP